MQLPEIIRGVEPECLTLVQSHNSTNWTAEQNYAIQLLAKNSFSLDVAVKNPVSVQNALRNAAAIGVSLNPASKYAYLVPRDGGICLDISYMGLIHLAVESGSIEFGQAKLVYETDNYVNQGVDKAPLHEYKAFGTRGNLVGAYCVVRTATGAYLTEEMSIEQIMSVRNRSESAKKNKGPWVSDFEEMCRKTVVKRGSKYWPKADRLHKAIDYLNTDGDEGISSDVLSVDVTPISSESLELITEIYGTSTNPEKLWAWLCNSVAKRNLTGFEDLTEIEAQKAIKAIRGAK